MAQRGRKDDICIIKRQLPTFCDCQCVKAAESPGWNLWYDAGQLSNKEENSKKARESLLRRT